MGDAEQWLHVSGDTQQWKSFQRNLTQFVSLLISTRLSCLLSIIEYWPAVNQKFQDSCILICLYLLSICWLVAICCLQFNFFFWMLFHFSSELQEWLFVRTYEINTGIPQVLVDYISYIVMTANRLQIASEFRARAMPWLSIDLLWAVLIAIIKHFSGARLKRMLRKKKRRHKQRASQKLMNPHQREGE